MENMVLSIWIQMQLDKPITVTPEYQYADQLNNNKQLRPWVFKEMVKEVL